MTDYEYSGDTIKMVAGVACRNNNGVDYDELLREALRVALRIDTDPENDNFDDLYTRIGDLMDAYVASPEGDDDPATLMTRLASCIADVIPLEERKRKRSRECTN